MFRHGVKMAVLLLSFLAISATSGLASDVNLLKNGGFDSGEPGSYWGVAGSGSVTVQTLTSTLGSGDGNMLHLTTDGTGGLVQTFLPYNSGPTSVTSSVWVYVLSGTVFIGAGNGGTIGWDGNNTLTNQWELISANNGYGPANEFVIYSYGPADFYVDNASVTDNSVQRDTVATPEPASLILLGVGALAVLKRRRPTNK